MLATVAPVADALTIDRSPLFEVPAVARPRSNVNELNVSGAMMLPAIVPVRKLPGHWHAPLVGIGPQNAPPWQTIPQVPQLFSSVVVSVHAPVVHIISGGVQTSASGGASIGGAASIGGFASGVEAVFLELQAANASRANVA